MAPEPSGTLHRTATGRDLVLTRRYAAPAEEIWRDLTESERTARWFGPWEGEPGGAIRVRMVFEEGEPWMDMHIETCEPPRRLELRAVDEAGSWHLEVVLTATADGTELALIHHLDEGADPGMVGPGWEYYLDLLGAARSGADRPDFGDYFPAQQEYFQRLG
ncbi:SRPBCC family protein [Nocardia asteroides]|uniref:SRPBCC family protein n=1 Tax=Nocardia asteroides TaxID=1824 RepID=UPI001E618852|nr:SRPBCC family protein [Nocardia asteroides]UGT63306.1 SRPBCC family protein [Nocardia asteroides]